MADKDGDLIATKEEFSAFLHPEEYDYMKDIVVQVCIVTPKSHRHNVFIRIGPSVECICLNNVSPPPPIILATKDLSNKTFLALLLVRRKAFCIIVEQLAKIFESLNFKLGRGSFKPVLGVVMGPGKREFLVSL